jgi:SAM-dependent methyltransferase
MSHSFDEVAHAGRENLDPAHVARFDAKMGDEDVRDEAALLRNLGLGPPATLVDLGAGTGLLALVLARHCRRVVAVDPSPVMRAALAAKLDAGSVQNVDVVAGGFLSYLPDEPVEFVYSRNALHHIPDAWKAIALTRVATMLRPGGVFRLRDLVYNFDASEFDDRVEAWYEAAAGDVETGWTRAELEEHVLDEHSTFTWLLEPMIERAGLEIRDAQYSDSGIWARYVCVKPW